MRWVPPVEGREQLWLFSRKIDDALPENHAVRQMAAVMDQVDWGAGRRSTSSEGLGERPCIRKSWPR